MAGKRSNPLKNFRDRAMIEIDKTGRAIKEQFDEAVRQKQRRKNPPPEVRGGKVTGFRRGPYPT